MIAVFFVIIGKIYRIWFTCLFLVCVMEAKGIGVGHKPYIYSYWQTIESLLQSNACFASETLCHTSVCSLFLWCCNMLRYMLHSWKTLLNFGCGMEFSCFTSLLVEFYKEISRNYFIYTGKFDAYNFSFQCWSLWLFIQAINFYSRANNIKSSDPIILGNRSAAYIRLAYSISFF